MRIWSIGGWLLFVAMATCVVWGRQLSVATGQAPTASVSAAPAAQIIPPPPDYHLPNGETYVYGVEWHMFSAGTSKVTILADGNQEHVIGVGESGGMISALYKVHDHFDAYFDPHTFCSTHVSKHSEEGSRLRQVELRFDYALHKGILDEKNLKTGESKHEETEIPGCVTDVVSGFYYVASLPLRLGNTYSFQVHDGKTSEVKAQVEGKEEVKVPWGKYQTVRVKAEATSGNLQGKGTVWAWFSDDNQHLPVQMRSKLPWGSLMFKLQRIEKQ